jgi:anti-anti-sigma factor
MKAWDFFIAHAHADLVAAETLYDQLNDHCRVFMDNRCLLLGDDWDLALASAQRESEITVVIISKNTARAYYQREEIASAIAMTRDGTHRLVPIFIYPVTPAKSEVPYGLRLKNSITARGKQGMIKAAQKLRQLLSQLNNTSSIVTQNGNSGNTDVSVAPCQVTPRQVESDLRPDKSNIVPIELRINRDFASFNPQEQARLIEAVKQLLMINSNIHIISIRKGSVLFTLGLPPELAAKLLDAVKAGLLADFGVVDAILAEGKGEAVNSTKQPTDSPSVSKNLLEQASCLKLLESLNINIIYIYNTDSSSLAAVLMKLPDPLAINDSRTNNLRNALFEFAFFHVNDKTLIFDLSMVDYLSSDGCAILIGLKRRIDVNGGNLVLLNVHPVVKGLMELQKLNMIFTFIDYADDNPSNILDHVASIR